MPSFADIVGEVMDRLNLSSTEARTRVGKRINERLRRVSTSIGLETTRRGETHATAQVDNRILTFSGVEKLIAVIDRTSSTQDVMLDELTPDEMHTTPLRADPPRNYAIIRQHSNSVDIKIDSTPATAFILYADAHLSQIDLAGTQVPDLPESFHDILVFGGLADEYRKMEKESFFKDAEADYERRLSDLRMWIAKSSYMKMYQGKDQDRRWFSGLSWEQ